MGRIDPETAIVAAVSAVLAAASIVAIASVESSHRPEPGTPVVVERDEFFYGCMYDAARNYRNALAVGLKPEDARYLLPEAAKTAITVTMNAHELFHFLDMRQSKAAQWEIRELANEVEHQLRKWDQWGDLLALRGGDAR